MRIFQCNSCGSHESLTFMWPDACSRCGGSLVQVSGPPYVDTIEMAAYADGAYADIGEPAVVPPASAHVPHVLAAYAVVIAIAVLCWWLLSKSDAEAMDRCQRTHSFDTCFLALNR
jgi:hypothetical protein